MSKNLSMITKNIGRKLKKHSPEILTGIGIAGMISATVMAVRATPKALQNIEHEKKEQNVTKLPLIEIAKCTWKSYIPSAVTIVVSSVCLVGASTVSFKRNTALATAYAMTEATLKSYQEKVVETIGEKKADAIKNKGSQTKSIILSDNRPSHPHKPNAAGHIPPTTIPPHPAGENEIFSERTKPL